MSKMIPLISSSVAGPLGALHLPRLWLKASLEARGNLAEGYPGCGKGYDQMVLDGLGIDRNAFLSFIKHEKPTYPECEAWIRKQSGAKLDAASIDRLNISILGYLHKDEVRKNILDANGIPDTGKIKDAVNLNNLDDWKEFHSAFLQ